MSHSIQTLLNQHRDCDEALLQLERHARAGDWLQMSECFAAADYLTRAHLALEEQTLFPAFEQASGMVHGPTVVMRQEHDAMRDQLDAMRDALQARDAEGLLAELDTLLVLIQQHNVKEENVLYPMCQQFLPNLADLLGQRAAISPAACGCKSVSRAA